MGGYCPVSIRDSGLWVVGVIEFQAEYDGKVYWMVGEAERASFLENPASYLPALGGDCAVTLSETNRRIPGNIFHAVQYENRLFLFAGSDEKQAFKASPASYANVDLALDGNCIVTQVDEKLVAAGLPEHVSWHRGKRYFFATRPLQEKFLANPARYVEWDNSDLP